MKYSVWIFIAFSFVLYLFVNPSLARAVDLTYDQTTSAGGTGYDRAYSVATDSDGNFFVCGEFTGTTDQNPDGDDYNFTSLGSTDIFVAKYSSTHAFQWAKAIGGTGLEKCHAIATDSNGDIFFAGQYATTVNFNPDGSDNRTSNGSGDLFLSKLNSDGSYGWTVATGGTSTSDRIYEIAIDGANRINVTGDYGGTNVNFNPLGTASTATSVGSSDIFVAQYDTAGQLNWVKSIGSSLADTGYGIAVSGNNDVLVVGSFNNTVNFNPDGSANRTAQAWNDGFVWKMNSDGTFDWVIQIAGDVNDLVQDVAINGANVYISGYTDGTANFDPSGSELKTAQDSTQDFFVAKYGLSDGVFSWVQLVNGPGYDYVNDLAVDSSDNLFLVGVQEDDLDFDPTAGDDTILAETGIFLTHYSGDGTYQWTEVPTTTNFGWGEPRTVIVDENKLIYSGEFSRGLDFDFYGEDVLSSNGNAYDLFFSVLNISGASPTPTPTPSPDPGSESDSEADTSSANNSSSSISSSSSSNPNSPSCSSRAPEKAPIWTNVFSANPNSATLAFFYPENADPGADGYLIEYGLESGNYNFGGIELEGEANYVFPIFNLSPDTEYFVRVTATNDCAVGPWSEEVSVTTIGYLSSYLNVTELDYEYEKEGDEDEEAEETTPLVKTTPKPTKVPSSTPHPTETEFSGVLGRFPQVKSSYTYLNGTNKWLWLGALGVCIATLIWFFAFFRRRRKKKVN